ncbi:hypothetical protein AAG906_027226 [Vitis piasezkii]
MSFWGETSNKEGGEESSLMLQAMQQQFERMNVVAPNARKQGRRARVDDFDDYHEDEFEDEEDRASLNHEEVSGELQDGKMGLIEA